MASRETVFIVDDDAAAAASLAALMISVGLDVDTYSSAEDFLAKYEDQGGGCLVLDVRLGGMDGLELQRQLLAKGCRLPIIVISGHADRELTERAIGNGAVACFEKPFQGQELCGTVRSVLAGD